MAKFKAAKRNKTPARSNRQAIPCFIVIITGIVLMTMLFYAVLKSSF